jgi:hypothetical protein
MEYVCNPHGGTNPLHDGIRKKNHKKKQLSIDLATAADR